MTDLVWIYITTKDAAQAREIGTLLVQRRLAACANVIPSIESVYEWKGEIVHDREAVLIVKTRSDLQDKLIDAVRSAHSYECPCIVALPISGGSDDYLKWLRNQTDGD
jgi:periplasmic divalent cation tolerance protein